MKKLIFPFLINVLICSVLHYSSSLYNHDSNNDWHYNYQRENESMDYEDIILQLERERDRRRCERGEAIRERDRLDRNYYPFYTNNVSL